MASYCDEEDIGRVGVNAEATDGISAEDVMALAIQGASDEIDSYLSQRYTLPLSAWGQKIKEVCAVMAAWTIVSTRGIKPGENPEDTVLRMRYEDALAWLKLVAEGKVGAPVTPAPDPGTGATSVVGPLLVSNVSRGWQDDYRGAPSGVPFAGRRRG